MKLPAEQPQGDANQHPSIHTREIGTMPRVRRVHDWLSTSWLGLRLLLVLIVPVAVLWGASQGFSYLLNRGILWSAHQVVHPRSQSWGNQCLRYVVIAAFVACAVGLVLAVFRSFARLAMICVLLNAVKHQDRPSVARHRFRQFLWFPKGFGLIVVSGFVGALLGLSVADTRQAHVLLHSVMSGLAGVFVGLMALTAFFLSHEVGDDLEKMGPDKRTAATRRLIYRWKYLCPRNTRVGRLLHPSTKTTNLMIRFALKPSTRLEIMLPTAVLAALIGYLVLVGLSPMY